MIIYSNTNHNHNHNHNHNTTNINTTKLFVYVFMCVSYHIVLLSVSSIFRCAMSFPYSSCSLYVVPIPPPHLSMNYLFSFLHHLALPPWGWEGLLRRSKLGVEMLRLRSWVKPEIRATQPISLKTKMLCLLPASTSAHKQLTAAAVTYVHQRKFLARESYPICVDIDSTSTKLDYPTSKSGVIYELL